MQTGIDFLVLSKFSSNRGILGFAEMCWQPRVEHLRKNVLAFSFESDRLSQTTSDDLTKETVFNAIVQKDAAAFHIEEVGDHLHNSGKVEF